MNWKRFFAVVFTLLVALSLSPTRLAAQTSTTGDVAGVVTDPSNAVVPDAKLDLKDNAKGNTQNATTNKDGAFRFYLLSPGSYTLTITASGFQVQSRQLQVAVGQIFTADVQLSLGTATQTVTVTEAAPLIQTENGDTASALNQQQISEIPNPGGDLSAIAELAPGVVTNTAMGQGNVEAFGMPAASNLFTLDGMDDNDPFLNVNNSGSSNLLLGSNEIQEADVVTNGYSSSFGTFAGMNINYITKSGGNDFHGNAIYYWNGRAMNSNSWLHNDFGEARPFDNANQWAASIGGPIKKDKLFFFFNNEGLRVLIPVPAVILVPTTAFEQATIANLTALGQTASIPFYCQNLANICPGVGPINAASGAGMFNLYNAVKNQANATPTPGGGCSNIPTSVFAGQCTNSILETPVNFAPEVQLAFRTDWNVGPNDRAYLRMQYDHGIQPTETDPVSPLFNATSNQPEYQGQLNETHIFNPSLTNQFSLAATWYSAIFEFPNQAQATAAIPAVVLVNDGSLTQLGGANFAFPQGRNVTQFQIGDDISKTVGNHTFKFGAKYHKNYVSDHQNGILVTPLEVPLTLGDFFNGGNPDQATSVGNIVEQHFPVSQDLPIRLYEAAGYIQDEWRVKPNFTITPALRLEHASNPTCVTSCFAQLFPNQSLATIEEQNAAGIFLPYNQQVQTGRRQALLGYQNLQWEPRVSFAWQPFGSSTGMLKSNFVVRGGAGIFYDIFPGAVADFMTQNPPLDTAFTLQSLSPNLTGSEPTCPGFISPNQTAGSNLLDCETAANRAFNTAFATGSNVTTFAPNITVTPPKTTAPEFYKWSLEIQKGFGAKDSISVGYYGNHGIHLPFLNNGVNAFAFSPNFVGLPQPVIGPSGEPAGPAQQYGVAEVVQNSGISNYNGVVASYKHTFSGWAGSGLVQFNYTYSHAFDNISNGGFLAFATNQCGTCVASIANPQNPFDPKQNYGPADYDIRHNVNANYVWGLPIRKALMGHGWAPLVDGWQVSGAAFYRTGLPFSVMDSTLTGVNNYNSTILPNIAAGASPALNCGSEKNVGNNAVPCYTSSQFVGVGGQEDSFGVRGLRNLFRGPSYFNTNFSFNKNTKIPGWERGELGLGLQFFNLFNHPNFAMPVNSATSSQFGTIQSMTSAPTSILGSFLGGDASPRLIQLKAQLTF
jgi:hypothetical protein